MLSAGLYARAAAGRTIMAADQRSHRQARLRNSGRTRRGPRRALSPSRRAVRPDQGLDPICLVARGNRWELIIRIWYYGALSINISINRLASTAKLVMIAMSLLISELGLLALGALRLLISI